MPSGLAERAFLVLAGKWREQVQSVSSDAMLPRDADTLALSCLTLAVEWGSDFTVQAEREIEANTELLEGREGRGVAWLERLVWDLCLTSNLPAPSESEAVKRLTRYLDHPNSSIRHWMMELGWTAHRWLAVEESTAPLLKNLADTLGSALMAAGLAAKLAGSGFLARPRRKSHDPPGGARNPSFGPRHVNVGGPWPGATAQRGYTSSAT